MTNMEYIRRVNGLTLRELSKLVGISFNYLSEIESGRKKNPGVHIRKRLREAFGEEWYGDRLMDKHIPSDPVPIIKPVSESKRCSNET